MWVEIVGSECHDVVWSGWAGSLVGIGAWVFLLCGGNYCVVLQGGCWVEARKYALNFVVIRYYLVTM